MNNGEDQPQPVGVIRRAEHTGTLRIGDLSIPCAVLEDGTRVLSERGVIHGLGVQRSGHALRAASEDSDGGRLPLYFGYRALRPFITSDLAMVVTQPIYYRDGRGGRAGRGLEAKYIPQICDVWLRARDAGALTGSRQLLVAGKADMLMRALAHVGIIALVDEATGYQRVRPSDALAKILELYISKELARWAKVFPDAFYRELFRLRGWRVGDLGKRPGHTAKLTNDLVYSRLAPGLLDELKRLQRRSDNGQPLDRLHQRLNDHIGYPRLREHLAAVTALMAASTNWASCMRMLDRALPRQDIADLFPGEGYGPEADG